MSARAGSPRLRELVVGGEAGPWREVGFTVDAGRFRVGSTDIRLEPGRGLLRWSLTGLRSTQLDGLATQAADDSAAAGANLHTNGALAIDHVVVTTPDLGRTLAALEAAGLDLRRTRDADSPNGPVRQAFYRVGEAILEVVAPPGAGEGPAVFWGLVFTVGDLDACVQSLGGLVGEARDAVQPGRRIATVRRQAGLGLPVALMSPAPDRG